MREQRPYVGTINPNDFPDAWPHLIAFYDVFLHETEKTKFTLFAQSPRPSTQQELTRMLYWAYKKNFESTVHIRKPEVGNIKNLLVRVGASNECILVREYGEENDPAHVPLRKAIDLAVNTLPTDGESITLLLTPGVLAVQLSRLREQPLKMTIWHQTTG